MHADSRYLTAFKTRQGTFRWKVLPFGLKVGPAWWQAFINAQLNELLDLFASAYADDVLVYTDEDNDETHFNQVEEVIYRLHRAELQGDIKKSWFNVQTVNYLGMIVEAGQGVRVDPEKVKAILDWDFEDHCSNTAIRPVVPGTVQLYPSFLPPRQQRSRPTDALAQERHTARPRPWARRGFREPQAARSFHANLRLLRTRSRDKSGDLRVTQRDGRNYLKQEDGAWKPVSYFSKTMTPAE